MLSIIPLANNTPKAKAAETMKNWMAMTNFLRSHRSANTPPHGPSSRTGSALTATVRMEWSAEPLTSKANQPMVMNWSHWAQLPNRLPVHR